MEESVKPNNKKTNAKASGNSQKKFKLSRKQLTIGGIVGVLALAGIGYWVYSANFMDDANAGNCVASTYRKGSYSTCVSYIQQAVGAKQDKSFGAITDQKVHDYQKSHGLTPDGVVGPNTWRVMCNTSFSIKQGRAIGCKNGNSDYTAPSVGGRGAIAQ